MHFRQITDRAGLTAYLGEGRRACYLIARGAGCGHNGPRAWSLAVHPADAEMLIDEYRIDGAVAPSKALLVAAARVYEEGGDLTEALDEAEAIVERTTAVWSQA